MRTSFPLSKGDTPFGINLPAKRTIRVRSIRRCSESTEGKRKVRSRGTCIGRNGLSNRQSMTVAAKHGVKRSVALSVNVTHWPQLQLTIVGSRPNKEKKGEEKKKA